MSATPAPIQWQPPPLEPADVWDFVESDAPIRDPAHAVELFCALAAYVARDTDATTFPDEAIDGFCPRCPAARYGPEAWGFKNTGAAFRAIARAARAAHPERTP